MYITQKLLGRGTYGEVYQVMDASTGAVYAVKELYNMAETKLHIEKRKAFTKEVDILRRLDHVQMPFAFPSETCLP